MKIPFLNREKKNNEVLQYQPKVDMIFDIRRQQKYKALHDAFMLFSKYPDNSMILLASNTPIIKLLSPDGKVLLDSNKDSKLNFQNVNALASFHIMFCESFIRDGIAFVGMRLTHDVKMNMLRGYNNYLSKNTKVNLGDRDFVSTLEITYTHSIKQVSNDNPLSYNLSLEFNKLIRVPVRFTNNDGEVNEVLPSMIIEKMCRTLGFGFKPKIKAHIDVTHVAEGDRNLAWVDFTSVFLDTIVKDIYKSMGTTLYEASKG